MFKSNLTPDWNLLPFWTRISVFYAQDLSNRHLSFILRAYSLLQTLTLIAANLDTNTTNREVRVSLVKDIVGFVNMVNLFDGLSIIRLTLTVIGIYLLLLMIGFLISCILIFNKSQLPAISGFFSLLLIFHTEILFYPISLFLIELLIKGINDESEIAGGVSIAVTIILMIFNLIITLFKTFCCYCPIKTKFLTCRKNSFHMLGDLILKLSLITLQSPISNPSSDIVDLEKVLSVIIAGILSLALLLNTHYNMPEYNLSILKLYIVYDSIATSIVMSQIIALIIKEYNRDVFLAWLILGLFWIRLNMSHFDNAVQDLVFKCDKVKRINHIIHLKTLFKDIKEKLPLITLQQHFSSKTLHAKWLLYSRFNEPKVIDPEIKQEANQYKEASRKFLKKHFEKFLESKVNHTIGLLGYSHLIVSHFNMYPKAYHLCQKLHDRRLNIPNQIALYQIMRTAQDGMENIYQRNSGEDRVFRNLGKTLVIEEKFDFLTSQFQEYNRLSIEFWRLLKEDIPDMFSLFMKGTQIRDQESKIQRYWTKNMAESALTYPLAYLIYGFFKASFLNQPHVGKEYIEKFGRLTRNKLIMDNVTKVVESDSASIMISGERSKMGTVLDCSNSVLKIFGISKTDLIGQDVKVIMPKFFQEKHHQFLLKYYETGKSELRNGKRVLYGKDKDNFVFRIRLDVSMHPDLSKGVVYTGIITKTIEQNEYIFVRKGKIIEEVSAGVQKLLQLEPYGKANINNVCPNYCSNYVNLDKSKSFSRTIRTQKSQQDLTALLGLKTSDALSQEIKDEGKWTFVPTKPNPKGKENKDGEEEELIYDVQIDSFTYGTDVLDVIMINIPQQPEEPSEKEHEEQKEYKDEFIDIFDQVDEEEEEEEEDEAEYRLSVEEFPERVNKQLSSKKTTAPSLMQKSTAQKSTIKFSDMGKLLNTKQQTESLLSEKKTTLKLNTNEIPTNEEEGTPGIFHRVKYSVASLSTTTSSSFTRTKAIDQLKITYDNQPPDSKRKLLTLLFGAFLVISLVTVGVEHNLFNSAVKDIRFTVNVIQTSYDRLDALIWTWRFIMVYQTRIINMYPPVTADLERYKLVIATYQEKMKSANHLLQTTVSQRDQETKNVFFKRNIEFYYNHTGERQILDNLQAYSVVSEKIKQFVAKPQAELLLGVNPEIDFVMTNSANDLLVISERIIQYFEAEFLEMVSSRQDLLSLMTILNVIIMLIGLLILLLNFRSNLLKCTRLFKALITINPADIDTTISKFAYFDNIIKEKQWGMMGNYSASVIKTSIKSQKKIGGGFTKFSKSFQSLGIFKAKFKQVSVLLILLACFACVYFYRSLSSHSSFDELVITYHRLVTVSRARYTYNLAVGTVQNLVAFQNSTTMRNERIDLQAYSNLAEISSNQFLIDQFLDPKTKTFIDPFIEMIFESKLCPYLPDFPGAVTLTNCLKSTLDESIGLFAVNLQYYQELIGYVKSFLNDTSYANTKSVFSTLTSATTPKFYVTVGAYVVLSDFMTNKFNDQASGFLNTELTGFILEIIFMSMVTIASLSFLIVRVNNDEVIQTLLKMIPHEEVIKNKLLKSVVLGFYREQVAYLKKLN